MGMPWTRISRRGTCSVKSIAYCGMTRCIKPPPIQVASCTLGIFRPTGILPFWSHELVNCCSSLPRHYNVSSSQSRIALPHSRQSSYASDGRQEPSTPDDTFLRPLAHPITPQNVVENGMRSNIVPVLSLVLATSAAAYLPFNAPQQPLQAGPSQQRYDDHQVWRLDWSDESQDTRRAIKEAVNVGTSRHPAQQRRIRLMCCSAA